MALAVILNAKLVEQAETDQHTASTRTIIDKCTLTNISVDTETVNVHLTNGAAASSANKVLVIAIDPGKAYLCAEIVGHVLGPGNKIITSSGTGGAVVMRVSGRTF